MSALDGRARWRTGARIEAGVTGDIMVSRGQTNAKKAQENLGFKMLKLNRSSLRELAKCLGGARLDGLGGRKRNFLSQHCELLGLLGQCFELLA
jgi:hypothetical protein